MSGLKPGRTREAKAKANTKAKARADAKANATANAKASATADPCGMTDRKATASASASASAKASASASASANAKAKAKANANASASANASVNTGVCPLCCGSDLEDGVRECCAWVGVLRSHPCAMKPAQGWAPGIATQLVSTLSRPAVLRGWRELGRWRGGRVRGCVAKGVGDGRESR